MSHTHEFYKDKFNDIQRHAYYFLNEVPLTAEEQGQIVKLYFLGTNFETVESIQDYNNDWLIKGYVKVDIRDVKAPMGTIKGKFLNAETFLKESMVQLPKKLFEMAEEELRREIYSSCMKIAAKRINERIASLRMQKIQIEAEIKRYSELLKEYPTDL